MATSGEKPNFKIKTSADTPGGNLATMNVKGQHLQVDNFLNAQQKRLDALLYSLRDSQHHFLDYVSLLFHINYPTLPGYIKNESPPAGIKCYHPSQDTFKLVSRYVKTFNLRSMAVNQYQLEGIYLQCRKTNFNLIQGADFELWICYDSELDAHDIRLLEKKCVSINQWATSLELNVKVIPLNITAFRAGSPIPGYEEDSLLKLNTVVLNEFYATGLYLSGKIPRWWLVPPDQDPNTEEYLDSLFNDNTDLKHISLDFGPLPGLAPGELLTMGFHLLENAFDHIYSSTFNIMLLIMFLKDSSLPPTSNVYKQRIYENKTEPKEVDPNIIAHELLHQFFESNPEEHDAIELMRRCFYLSVSRHIDAQKNISYCWKKDELAIIVTHQWQWSKEQKEYIDAHGDWEDEKLMSENLQLGHRLLQSFATLSQFLKDHPTKTSLTSAQYQGIGKKLKSLFAPNENRIRLFNLNIQPIKSQEKLIFSPPKNNLATYQWQLSIGASGLNQKSYIIYRANYIFEIIAWAHFNGLLNSSSLVALNPGQSLFRELEFNDLIHSIQREFPHEDYPPTHPKIMSLPNEVFLKPPEISTLAIYINVGHDPMKQFSRQGMHQISQQSDSLSYSSTHTNLVQSVETIEINSWQEISYHVYEEDNALLTVIIQYLQHALDHPKHQVPKVIIECFCPQRNQAIKTRVEELFTSIYEKIFNIEMGSLGRFIFQLGKQIHMISVKNDKISLQSCDYRKSFIKWLEAPQTDFSPIYMDVYEKRSSTLATIFKNIIGYKINVFFLKLEKHKVQLIICDEWGSMIEWSLPWINEASLINPLYRFLRFIEAKQTHCLEVFKTIKSPENNTGIIPFKQRPIHMYEVKEEIAAPPKLTPTKLDPDSKKEQFYNFQVLVEATLENKPSVTLYCNQQTFKESELGNDVYQKCIEYLLTLHEPDQAYPCMVSDLEISHDFRSKKNTMPFQTIVYLHYKKQVEQGLNQALSHQLSQRSA